ncbi:MAG: Ig-like domain-containing protein [Lachnospiraceae bacterium]
MSTKKFLVLTLACILMTGIVCTQEKLSVQAVKSRQENVSVQATGSNIQEDLSVQPIGASKQTKVKKITLNKKKLTVGMGESQKLTAKLSPTKAKNVKVTWTTSNTKVAKVKNGKVTGVSTGTAIITAKAGSKKATCQVKVVLSQKAKKVVKAYQKYMQQPRIRWTNSTSYGREQFKFSLADINGDGLPELMLQNNGKPAHFEGYEAVYCYYNGQVKQLDRDDMIRRYYPKKGIIVTYYSGMGCSEYYMKISKSGTISEVGRAWNNHSSIGPLNNFKWKRKRVTQKEFYRLVKKEAGKNPVEMKRTSWYQNNAANRKNMEKLVKW